ncbi:MAG: acetyl-CoA carboxylase biotin carboxylase subunit [Elusimicrobiaceae bacterium]|nr:acetyl-CoA carboxylase biotin carboxylase subunit [Elusimicrobiaceae bacterium]
MIPFKKVLVANRGEIALRIIRALKENDILSVAVYSEADRGALHVRQADEAVCIGAAPARSSYLDIPSVVAAAKLAGADAVHPGYGFLSENPAFSKAVTDAGMVFIGPTPETIALLGYKAAARKLAVEHKVPIVPGTKEHVHENALEEAKKVGFPVMIKASAGGGGKGMRIARTEAEFEKALQTARTEAKAAFGDDGVYVERYVEKPRHIEIQIAADSHGSIIAFPERDCSVQRRHQKLVEESPAPAVTPAIRAGLMQAAKRLIRASGYTGVGTVEFLMDSRGEFYFMEVNTRLQVEHPVTETVSGVDLVQLQLDIAQNKKLHITQERAAEIRCHAIEFRINAEDPGRDFAAAPGAISEWIAPGGPGVRVDTGIYPGYEIPSYYDSMIAKLIVSAPDRAGAISRGRRALSEFHISGVKSTIPFHLQLLDRPEFKEGSADTGLVEKMFSAAPAQTPGTKVKVPA